MERGKGREREWEGKERCGKTKQGKCYDYST